MDKKLKTSDEDVITYKDIRNTHELICDRFASEVAKLPELDRLIEEVSRVIANTTQKAITQTALGRYKRKLEYRRETTASQAQFNDYMDNVSKVLMRYISLASRPITSGKVHDISSADYYVKLFNNIAKRFFDIVSLPQTQTEACPVCGGQQFVSTDVQKVCKGCRFIVRKSVTTVSYDDKERVNMNGRYKYVRKQFFREAMKQYQGQQREDPPDEVTDYINAFLCENNLTNEDLTIHMLWSMFKDNNYAKYNSFIHKIYYGRVKKSPPDISKLESELLADFDLLDKAYEEMTPEMKDDRDNALNSFYVLFRLLERHNYQVTKEEKDVFLKDRPRIVAHDQIYKKICKKLGWKPTGTV